MNPTPVVTTSTGPQQLPNQKQEILPEEFETQLAGYLKKEQPSTIHKEVSDSEKMTEKENQDQESNEEPTDETLNLNSPLFYTGLFNPRQEQQPAEASLNESSKTEVIQLLKSSEPTFDKQVNVEAEKIAAFVQNKNPVANRQQNRIEESFVEPVMKEVTEPQTILKDKMVMSEEPTDETLSLDKQLLYTGLINPKQESQPAERKQNEPSKHEVISPMKSSEPTFDKQVNGENGKMVAFIQNEDLVTNKQQSLVEESIVDPEMKEVIEPIVKANGENILEDVTSLLMEESILVETELDQSPVKKETVMTDTILSTGRFLTAEWKNGRIVNQPIIEPDTLTVNSLNELPTQIKESLIDNGQQPETDINGSKLTVLTESLSTERVLKDTVSRFKNSESYEALTKVTEVDAQRQPVQQQQIVEAASIKQSSVAEPIKQAGIQLVSEVVTQQAETVLSGKQSIAHVTLTPERMGEVNITVELKDNVLITKIVVDTMETKELLANGMHQLTDKLDRQNIRLGDLTIQVNENASSHFSSQERQGEEQKSTFGQQKINVTANEKETLKSEDIVENNTKRLSILV